MFGVSSRRRVILVDGRSDTQAPTLLPRLRHPAQREHAAVRAARRPPASPAARGVLRAPQRDRAPATSRASTSPGVDDPASLALLAAARPAAASREAACDLEPSRSSAGTTPNGVFGAQDDVEPPARLRARLGEPAEDVLGPLRYVQVGARQRQAARLTRVQTARGTAIQTPSARPPTRAGREPALSRDAGSSSSMAAAGRRGWRRGAGTRPRRGRLRGLRAATRRSPRSLDAHSACRRARARAAAARASPRALAGVGRALRTTVAA